VDLQEQSASFMYAHNGEDNKYSISGDLISLHFDKLAANVVVAPRHFSMTINTPFDRLQ